ncbi:helix-turn-helix domain-containing protein [Puteibacter caeruleilacunae]|nr:helix-turn-helix domain-containing protein [Puteibacter caeruleilacunae]
MNDKSITEYTTEDLTASVEKLSDKNIRAIVARVRQALDEHGWSLKEFAEMMGVSPTNVYEWMSGAYDLTMRQIITMEMVLDIDLTYCDDDYEETTEEEEGFLDELTKKQIDQAIKIYRVKHDMTTNYEQQWLAKYLILVDFFKEYGHANFPTQWKNQKSMGHWTCKQREMEKLGTIDLDKRELLKLLNFNFLTKSRNDWEEMYGKLIEYKFNHGHANIPSGKKTEKLYKWLSWQKQLYWRGKLEYDKLRRLKKIGIEMRHQTLNQWNESYSELKKFKREHGHINLTKANGASEKLMSFVRTQRYSKNTMPKKRKQLLDNLGFQWEVDTPLSRSAQKRGYQHWLNRYAELVQYKEEYGTSYISRESETHRSLGIWVSTQRKRRKELKPEQIEMLREIDFFIDNGVDF